MKTKRMVAKIGLILAISIAIAACTNPASGSPATGTTTPSKQGTNLNLKTLIVVTGQSLNPSFDPAITDYTITTASFPVRISARTQDKYAGIGVSPPDGFTADGVIGKLPAAGTINFTVNTSDFSAFKYYSVTVK